MELRLDRHEVQVGETVQSIATQTGIPIEQLRKWNRLFGNEVYPTQVIIFKYGRTALKLRRRICIDYLPERSEFSLQSLCCIGKPDL